MKQLFPIYISSNQLSSNSQKTTTLSKTKRLGEFRQGKVIYSFFEALYLIETNNAELIKNNKPLSEEKAENLLSKNQKDFLIKYLLFKHLRQKGFIVKTGLKFGSEFRVYSRPKNQKDSSIPSHAKYLCYPLSSVNLKIHDLISKSRIAHSTAKSLLLAIVDSEHDVIFYEINWMKI